MVISEHFARCSSCPLYPQKQTSPSAVGMSAKCQKQTFCAAVKNVAIDYFISNEQRRGYVEAAAVTDVDPTARPSAA